MKTGTERRGQRSSDYNGTESAGQIRIGRNLKTLKKFKEQSK